MYFFSLFSNCRKNKPLFQAGPFDQAFNITDRLNIEKVSLLAMSVTLLISVCQFVIKKMFYLEGTYGTFIKHRLSLGSDYSRYLLQELFVTT